MEYNDYCFYDQERMDAADDYRWHDQQRQRLQQHCPICDQDHALDSTPIQVSVYVYEFRCLECGAILRGYSSRPYDDGVEQVGETDEHGDDHYWEKKV